MLYPFILSFLLLTFSDWSQRVWLPDGHLLQSSVYIESRLTLGGGIGQLSGEHGLVINNLIKVISFPDHATSA